MDLIDLGMLSSFAPVFMCGFFIYLFFLLVIIHHFQFVLCVCVACPNLMTVFCNFFTLMSLLFKLNCFYFCFYFVVFLVLSFGLTFLSDVRRWRFCRQTAQLWEASWPAGRYGIGPCWFSGWQWVTLIQALAFKCLWYLQCIWLEEYRSLSSFFFSSYIKPTEETSQQISHTCMIVVFWLHFDERSIEGTPKRIHPLSNL